MSPTPTDGILIQYRLDGSIFNLRRIQTHTKTRTQQILDLQYMDECALLDHTPESMQRAVKLVSSLYQSVGLKINTQKTEIIAQLTPASPPPPTFTDNVPLKVVPHFTYLGASLFPTCSLDDEIHTRVNRASISFGPVYFRTTTSRPAPSLETLAMDRSTWRSTCASGVQQLEDSITQRRCERSTKRHQQAAWTLLSNSQHTCPSCNRVCGSRISLESHMKWHRRQER
ncbi:hypothetical protein SKAU_G00112130 [Synaphobranchus kaupii]|uniref:C2H2-type domain-containing protein n=1 Tax=Synaphobranchus kaupii TaxID=118154 RepID=A0A9Q1G1G3_SYNKA|nr:hypothetical protein SKAU_G00112130 [Synaphobranchus kaupii]